jgi:hypothetical protein
MLKAEVLPPGAITAAMDEVTRDRSAMLLEQANREVYRLLKEGIPVSVADRDISTPHPGPLPGRDGEGGASRTGADRLWYAGKAMEHGWSRNVL